MKHRTRRELRCDCPSKQILLYYGISDKGEIYLHIKSFRSGRTTSNVVAYGTTDVQCPSCGRWHKITIGSGRDLQRTQSLDPPAEIAETETLARTNSA